MSNNAVVAQCTHVKTNGEVCGSPAVSGTEFCYHHSVVKTALSRPLGKVHSGGFAPIGFVFPEDRAAMQINFFLLLQAYNERRIDQRTYNAMLSVMKAMARNLGRMGSLVDAGEPISQKQDAGHPPKRPAASEKASLGNGSVSLIAASAAELRPEACFSNAVFAPASPAYLSMKAQTKSCVR